MKLGPIVLQLRLGNTRFKENIAGAAEMALAMKNTLLKEAAFVIPLSESCPPNLYDSGINQKFNERFAVVVAIRNDLSLRDRTGITSYDILHDVRTEIFKSVLGLQLSGHESIIYYAGGSLLDINPAYLWYQYEFEVASRLVDNDGVDEGYTDELESIYTQFELSPSINIPYDGDLPVTAFGPDMTTLVNIYDDPDNGAYSRAYDIGFDWYPKTDPWYN
jgi:hypothetical protein